MICLLLKIVADRESSTVRSVQGVVMELVILKAKAQLNRLLSGSGGRGGEKARAPSGGGRGAGSQRPRGVVGVPMAPTAPAPPESDWLNASLLYNTSRINASFDLADYDLLSINATEEHNNYWFCAKWTNAQQDLFQVTHLLT